MASIEMILVRTSTIGAIQTLIIVHLRFKSVLPFAKAKTPMRAFTDANIPHHPTRCI
jgi:hypothetical protein